jgi:two-component system NtrC family sensor kinase
LLKRIVFITGDTLGMGASTFLAQTGCPLIEKPFVPSEVIQVVRQILNLVD